jgi:hypothetical protein
MITAAQLLGFDGTELAEFQAGLDAGNRVLQSPSFDAAVLAHTANDGSIGFDDTASSASDVLAKIEDSLTAGISVRFQIVNPTMKMMVFHTVAYEEKGIVVFNRRRYLNEDTPALANTIVHEAMHAIGYGHPTDRLKPTSVPYGIGAIIEDLLRNPR